MIRGFGMSGAADVNVNLPKLVPVNDIILTGHYETNGIFAKIIDWPAKEAVKHGIDPGVEDDETCKYIMGKLNDLGWEEKLSEALKLSRLYGGALAVIVTDDSGDISEPLNLNTICDVVDIRVYDRGVIVPDRNALYGFNPRDPGKSGEPEYYDIHSIYGHFRAHESRCLIFKNGRYSEHSLYGEYMFWGLPEYIKIGQALHDATDSHHNATTMLSQAVQPILKADNFEAGITMEGAETKWRRILAVFDRIRSRFRTVVIGPKDTFEFKSTPLTGVKETADISKSMLSAVSGISETILWGSSPAGLNATGKSDLEASYNLVERIQKIDLKKNLIKLTELICIAGLQSGKIKGKPEINLTFNPLWSVSEQDRAAIDEKRANIRKTEAGIAASYVDINALDPAEVRATLIKEGYYSIDDTVTESGLCDELYAVLDEFQDALFKMDAEDEIFRTASNGKVFKKNTETGETSGLGPGIDGENAEAANQSDKTKSNDEPDLQDEVNNGNIGESNGVNLDIRPTVSHPKVQPLIEHIYKGQNERNIVGNGTTMAAVRNELATGQPTDGKFHSIKAQEMINGLSKRLRARDLTADDEIVVRALVNDLQNALNGD